ncbi:MAG: sugar ABC transporter permease [Propionibacteriaceae bacterium]|nr:sugar ABC transporter permease [Propionibacteriaceae bacterium]
MSSDTVTQPRRKRRRMSRIRRSEIIAGWGFMAPFAILFALVLLVPMITAIRSSLFRMDSTGGGLFGGGELTETFVGFANLQWAATNGAFWTGIARVGAYALFQIPVMTLGAMLLALLLDSTVIRRPGFFRISYFLPFAIPGIVAAMLWLYLYTPELSPIMRYLPSWVNFMAPDVILASMANMTTWTYTGYNMLIFLAALQAIPQELYEAARIDGAKEWQIATRIKIPIMGNAILLSVLMSIIGTVQLFNEPVVMETVNPWMGKAYTPMMMAYNTMTGGLSPSGNGHASAISVMMAIVAGVMALVYWSVQRKVTK